MKKIDGEFLSCEQGRSVFCKINFSKVGHQHTELFQHTPKTKKKTFTMQQGFFFLKPVKNQSFIVGVARRVMVAVLDIG